MLVSYVLAVICGAIFLIVDQITKYLVASNFTLGESRKFIDGLIDFVYIHNRGGAWGILEGKTFSLLLITAVLMTFCGYLLFKIGKNNKFVFWAITLIVFGGIGNIIDRIFRDGNVIDFLHFEFWPTFPVFNIADCAVVIGGGILMVYLFFDFIRDIKSKKQLVIDKNENN